ncbi:MAG: B12-binding domain-containing radical SAM protein [Eubacteriaceae bacterium]|nr:B12-binding domain-containing radical SAM protein [Eubacteriaceae bacterium]
MKIALLSPAGAMHRHDGLFSKNLHYAPMTLALLAALVPSELEADIAIYDETAGPIPLDIQADIIGITCITGTSARSYKYAEYYRSRGAVVALGGPHPSLCPDEAKEHADSVVIGLGDSSWPRLLLDYREGDLKEFYSSDPCEDIAGRPIARRDLLDKRAYITLNTVEAVRGCHLNCSFCAYPKAFGKRVLTRPVNDVIDEIKSLPRKEVVFPDVNLLSDMAYLKELLRAMIPLKKWWFGLTTSDIALNEELVELFEKSGCKGLLIGFESIDESSQAQMHKGINKPGNYKALMGMLHKHGIMVMGCFAFGADEDGPDVFDRTVRFADEVKIDLPRYAVFTPFPKTDYYNYLEAQGRITERNWALYDVEHLVFELKNMAPEELEQGMQRAWKDSYSFKSILKRWSWSPKLIAFGWLYLLANFGYRKYARKYEIFGSSIMADNSDIPEAIL